MCSLLDTADRLFVHVFPMRKPCYTFALGTLRGAAEYLRQIAANRPVFDQVLQLRSDIRALQKVTRELLLVSETVRTSDGFAKSDQRRDFVRRYVC